MQCPGSGPSGASGTSDEERAASPHRSWGGLIQAQGTRVWEQGSEGYTSWEGAAGSGLKLRQVMGQLGDAGTTGARAIRLGKTIEGCWGSAKGWPGSSLEPAGEHSTTGHQMATGQALWCLGRVAWLSRKETGAGGCSEPVKGAPSLGVGGETKLGLGEGAFCLCTADPAPVILCAPHCCQKDLFGFLVVSSGSCQVLQHSTLRHTGLSLATPPSCTSKTFLHSLHGLGHPVGGGSQEPKMGAEGMEKR